MPALQTLLASMLRSRLARRVSWPAEYGVSGVNSFMVNHDGVVYEKDLGDNTADEVEKIQAFDPDKTWSAVEQLPES